MRGVLEDQLDFAVASVLHRRRTTPQSRSALVAFSGIDGSGKGFVSEKMAGALEAQGLRVALINIDGWLNLPDIRFSRDNPAEHFYLHAIRFDEMFDRLVLPLRTHRSVRVEADFTEETARRYRKHLYEFQDVDIIMLEGIYLLKRQFQQEYDLSFWIDCSFDTALDRAIARSQEGLPAGLTTEAYRTIYFPAQEIHFVRDTPRAAASAVIDNDAPPSARDSDSLRALANAIEHPGPG